jgi:Uma2 family endonuclease
MSLKQLPHRQTASQEPTWEIAQLYPHQGGWSEEDYFEFCDAREPHPILELAAGRLEILPMPTEPHQFIMQFFFKWLEAFVTDHSLGKVVISGMKVRLKKGANPKYRGPDVMFMKKQHAHRRHEKYWDGADLVAEIVSANPKDRARDYKIKVKEYAAAGIPEYWIIDPAEMVIRVLTLKGKSYRIHGEFKPGELATSLLLSGFSVDVGALFAAAEM